MYGIETCKCIFVFASMIQKVLIFWLQFDQILVLKHGCKVSENTTLENVCAAQQNWVTTMERTLEYPKNVHRKMQVMAENRKLFRSF